MVAGAVPVALVVLAACSDSSDETQSVPTSVSVEVTATGEAVTQAQEERVDADPASATGLIGSNPEFNQAAMI